MISEELDDKIKTIRNKLSFVENLRKSLKDRVESNITSLFESNIALQERIYQRTIELDNINKKLQLEITERKQIEEALRLSEHRYKHLLGAITDYIYTVDVVDGEAVSTSHGPGCVAVTGYTSEEYVRDPFLWYQMIHAEDRHSVMEMTRRVLAGDIMPSIEHRITNKDGTIRWVRNTIVPRRDKEGALIAYDGLISDITERRRTDEALKLSEQRYKHLLNATTDYIYTVDVSEGRAVSTGHGPGCLAVTGYTSEEYAQDSFLWYRMIHPEDRHNASDMAGKTLRGEQVQPVEHRIIHKDGSIRWVRNTPVPRHDKDGVMIAYDGLITDITERKLAEEALRKNKERLADFFDNAYDMIQIVDMQGRFKYVNRSWLITLGYDTQEVETLNMSEIIHPDFLSEYDAVLHEILTTGHANRFETVFITKHGRHISVLGSVSYSYEHGKPSAARGIFHDLTEIKKAEDTLKRLNDDLELRVKERTAQLYHAASYLESVLTSLTDALFVINSSFTIRRVNLSACIMLEYKEKELVGKDIKSVFSENLETVINEVRTHEKAKDEFMTVRTKTGQTIPVLVNLSRLGKKNEETIIVVHDMRDIKKLEEETQRIQLKMLSASKMATLGEIATGIAHEINQPLTYISSFIQGLLLDIRKQRLDEKEVQKDAGTAYKQVGRIVDIIQHLRTFGRRDDLELTPVNIETVLNNTMLLIGERIRLKNIKLQRTLEKNELPCVPGSANQLEQVFINLLQNAMDAFPKGTANPTIKVNVSLSSEKRKWVVIKISDNASGIDPENLDKIFEPFFTTKEVGKGTGLGLSIVYGIISEHNGTIACESVKNKGTVFTIKIPACEETVGE
ncbi:PAS domain-containing sensor histidine kinase [Candidatus Magnetomonas plexicatena]|uniref:PAS domain-containing sensor histidine kinase n=1 Tax=Candidatus Magnetomonas plexicatena TaxID=2552947 RepID=UPI001C775886|nr:PAS domain S-box protein [Nitrospirales bacterium LBB_01]